MRTLTLKSLRDIGRLKAQLGAIALVMACGVSALVMSISASGALERSLDAYYDRARFADAFVSLKRAPLSLIERVREIHGVAEAEARIAVDVVLDAPGVAEPAIGRLVSIPERHDPALNRLHLKAGRMPEPGRAGEAVVNEAFAQALGVGPGDELLAVVNARRETIRIVGVALSPEFVYAIRAGNFVPDDRRFGVFWMRQERLAEIYDLDGAFNDLLLRLEPGASEAAVFDAVDALTEPWGGAGAFARKDQTSHAYVSDELEQLRSTSTVTPVVFLAVSALLLNIVLSRVVRTQREQIGVLKAFGYTRAQVAIHYLTLVGAVAFVGAALGVAGGALLADTLLRLYARFFRLPFVEGGVAWSTAALALAVTGAAAILGALSSVRRAAALPPAVAMRPEAPPDYRATFIEKAGLASRLAPPSRMILRHIERRPARALASVLGVALAIAVLSLGSYIDDAVDFLVDFQFSASQRQDLTLTFTEPRNEAAVRELGALPGVLESEPVRTVPVRLRHGPRWRLEAITGLPAEPRLNRALDDRNRPLAMPPSGLVLSSALADRLGADVGDVVTMEVLDGQRPTVEARVEAVAATYIGAGAYMDQAALRRLLREGDVATGAFLTIDSRAAPDLFRRLKETPDVASVTVKRAALDSFQKTIAQNLLILRLFNISFASVIAVGVVYNSARIALAERAHEFATLRVLGFYSHEVAAVFLGELALLALLAIPIGTALGYWFCILATSALTTETHRIPLVVSPNTLAFSVAFVLTAAIITAAGARRKIDQLDLLSVLKAAG